MTNFSFSLAFFGVSPQSCCSYHHKITVAETSQPGGPRGRVGVTTMLEICIMCSVKATFSSELKDWNLYKYISKMKYYVPGTKNGSTGLLLWNHAHRLSEVRCLWKWKGILCKWNNFISHINFILQISALLSKLKDVPKKQEVLCGREPNTLLLRSEIFEVIQHHSIWVAAQCLGIIINKRIFSLYFKCKSFQFSATRKLTDLFLVYV